MPKKAVKKTIKKTRKSPSPKPKAVAVKSKANKVKVTSLAKELDLDTKKLISLLTDLGVEVKTTASSIEEEQAKLVKDLVMEERAKQEEPSQEPSPKQDAASDLKKETSSETESAPSPVEEKDEQTELKILELTNSQISTRELSAKLGIKPGELIKELMIKGLVVNINQNLDLSVVDVAAKKYGYELQVKQTEENVVIKPASSKGPKKLITRPPIITVMGHVDHGKTKLLDTIRDTNVIDSESGGITQHIGAYQAEIHGRKVTFLDTPGHQAFTALRARGAKVTDIAVLVVAADDGVKPQTLEAVDHAKAAGVPIIVAINKIDKPSSNIDRVKQQLSEIGLSPEDWGGKTVTVPISAKMNKGIPDLLEMILLVADMQELKADPHVPAEAVVIESKLDKKQGPLVTVLIQQGTLQLGDSIVIGAIHGRVRALINDRGDRVKKAGPSMPVEILGLSEVPHPGDKLHVAADDKEAKLLANQHATVHSGIFKGRLQSLEEFSRKVKEGEAKNLNLIVKADVKGSLEALVGALSNLSTVGVRINIIHSGVGAISESDVMLAAASGSIMIGFRANFGAGVEEIAKNEGVDVRYYDVIYKVTEDIELAIEGMFDPEYEEVVIGTAEVRQLFHFSKVGTIAGCFVTSGKLVRGAGLRIRREAKEVFVGKLETLKRFKDDVKEVENNFECGLTLRNFDFKKGDQMEAFEMRQKARGK